MRFQSIPADVRFWQKVQKTEACWNWTASTTRGGYGNFRVSKSQCMVAHRWAYLALVGPIPEGRQLDHLCRNTRCVNPRHLEPVTSQVNVLRSNGLAALNSRKEECPKGHPLVGPNLYVYPRAGKPIRTCRECRNARQRVPAEKRETPSQFSERQRQKALKRWRGAGE